MLVARRLVVSGRVQGVGYRWFTVERAAVEGITGWVRNLPGGQVELVAEGDAEAVERFERAIRQGPGRARVDDVTVDILTPTGRFPAFSVHD
jgi:acylphosphatase